MAFLRTLLQRLLQGLALVLAVVVLNFMLVHAAPGDPVETIAGASGGMDPALMAELRARYGLDKPLPVQLGIYLARVASGDLGHSYFFNLPVAQMIAERVPATLLLVLAAVLTAFVAGTLLGVLSSRRPNGRCRSASPCCPWWALPHPCSGPACCWCWPSPPGGPSCRCRACARPMRRVAAGWPTCWTWPGTWCCRRSRWPWSTWRSTAGCRARPCWTCWAPTTSARRAYPTILGVLLFSSIVVVVMNLATDLCYRLIDPRIKAA
jgi:hypothetical protein